MIIGYVFSRKDNKELILTRASPPLNIDYSKFYELLNLYIF